jgi:hypothetical protein
LRIIPADEVSERLRYGRGLQITWKPCSAGEAFWPIVQQQFTGEEAASVISIVEEEQNMNGYIKKILAVAVMTVLAVTPAIALDGKWITGDFHQHTWITDGSNDFDDVIANGFRFGLSWQANSEHGGTSDQNDVGVRWSAVTPSVTRLGNPLPSGTNNLWRWQTLVEPDKVPFYLERNRAAFPDKILINGMEMNMPGAEHCSTAIVDPTGHDIAQFEYLWDRSDGDASGGYSYAFEDPANNGVTKNFVNNLTKAA